MNRAYDEFLLLPKLLLFMGGVSAIILNVFHNDSLPVILHLALGIYVITWGVFGFSLMLLPWWLLQKGIVREGLFSRRALFGGHIVYALVFVVPLMAILSLFWFGPTFFLLALHIAEHTVQWNTSLALFLVVFFGGYILSGLNMYWYIKEHKGF